MIEEEQKKKKKVPWGWIAYVSALLVSSYIGNYRTERLTKAELESKFKEDIKTARIIDVNGDSRNDLYIDKKLYINTERGLIPVEDYVGIERQNEINSLYEKVRK